MPQPQHKNVHRRTLRDVDPIIYTQIERRIFNLIMAESWPYSSERRVYYVTRDRAMMALTFLTMGRINEVLRLTKEQFDYDTYADFMIIHNFEISKRKEITLKKFGKVYTDIPISVNNLLLPIVEDHLNQINNRLFHIGRKRAWQIINYTTGLWCHWFRAQSQSFYVNKLGNPAIVSERFHVNIQTIMHYFRGDIADFMEKLR